MKVTDLKLSNIRNHELSEFILEDEVIFIGKNGVGKSSILEGLYFLLCFRGFKQQPLSLLIRFNEEFLRLESNVERLDGNHNYVLKYKDKREVSVDDESISDIGSYLYANIVAVNTPDSMGVLSQLQSDRRSFIDRFVFYTDRKYIDIIKQYNRLISQKAIELATETIDKLYIDILNEQIVETAKIIYDKRFNAISIINKKLGSYYKDVLPRVNIDKNFIQYESNILKYDIFEKELVRKRVTYGVQRDKIHMANTDEVIEKFSSFGQKKSFSLLVLLASVEAVEKIRGESALVMLDDFEAGLDINRANVLRELFSNRRQVLYTGVDAVRIKYDKIVDLDRR